jgi:glycosyltransferase involved in cell wall biosynthesis
LFESVPPRAYGGTERVISYLAEELVRQGHEVTLFASGDSVTQAQLVSACPTSIRPGLGAPPWMPYQAIQLDQVRQRARDFDVIHFHTDSLHLPLARMLPAPHVTTMHGRLDMEQIEALFRHFADAPMVSISDSQRMPFPDANWLGTVHHGLPPDLYRFNPDAGDYFLFVGRISREKRVDRAIEIARRCGRRLYIGAKVDSADETYYNEHIRPLLRDPLVEFLGEINEREKRELLEHAAALLFPIDWPEPFGLVMIEAFCCGTPVIAYRHGAVPEVMEDGVTGFIVADQEEAVRAAQAIDTVDRRACRDAFERRFTAARMAGDYLRIYQRAIGG